MTQQISPSFPSFLSRRSFVTALVMTPALAAILAACGDDAQVASTVPDQIVHPTGADEVVLRLGYEGGFVPTGYLFVSVPTLLVSGNRVFQQGATTLEYPGKLLPAITVRTISEAGIQKLLDLALKASLLQTPPDYTAETLVADAPDTVLTLNAQGSTFTHRAYALGFNFDANGNPGSELTPARQRLASFVTAVGGLEAAVGADNLGVITEFVPDTYRFQARVADPTELESLDPKPTIVDWPADTGVALADAVECGSAPAAKVDTVLRAATQLTYFRDTANDADTVYALAAVAVLPGDVAC